MNYLELLPNDVMKIINRKVQDAHIIKRRIERKFGLINFKIVFNHLLLQCLVNQRQEMPKHLVHTVPKLFVGFCLGCQCSYSRDNLSPQLPENNADCQNILNKI